LSPQREWTIEVRFALIGYFFLRTTCVSAEPAAVLDPLLEPTLWRTFEATEATALEVVFAGSFDWDRADPAEDLAALLVSGLRRTLDAALAAFLLVTSTLLLI
jgi:hypothetical protein